jgi:hypothetical protein
MFTIEVGANADQKVSCQIAGRFSVATWNTLWEELKVDPEQWKEWRIAVDSAQQDIPLLQDFPQISRLAYIDEGSVRFDTRSLQEECMRLENIVASDATRRLVADLAKATDLASEGEESGVFIHPFG